MAVCPCGNQLLKWLMSPPPKSQVMFGSAFSFCRIFGIHSFYATATLLNRSLSPAMNMWLTDAADGGCGGGLDFAPMHAICSVGQCDVHTFLAYRLAGAARRPLLMNTGTSISTGVDFEP